MSQRGPRASFPRRSRPGTPVPTDPFFSQVVHLSLFQGLNGATTFPAIVGSTFVRGGAGATLSTVVPGPFGGSSLLLGGDFVQAPSIANYAAGAQSFAVEFYGRQAFGGAQVLFDMRPGAEGAYMSEYANGLDLAYYVSSANRIGPATVLTSAAWLYYCLARDAGAGITSLYVGAVGAGSAARVGTWADATVYLQSFLQLGRGGFGTGQASGNMGPFRFTRGTDRGFSGATVPVPTTNFPTS